MNKVFKFLAVVAVILAANIVFAAPISLPFQGGTGTNCTPVLGQILLGTSGGIYNCVATSSLGIVENSGTVTSVNATSSTGLNFTGGPITTSGTLTLSGVLLPLNGGTGTTTNIFDIFPTYTYGSSTYYLASNPDGYITSSSLSPYMTYTYASSTFPSFSYASSTFITYNYASTTYPNYAYGSSTYYFASNPAGYITAASIPSFTDLWSTSTTGIYRNSFVGVGGTTTPSNLFSIAASSTLASTTPLFTIASSTSSGTATSTLFTILGNGYLGIGTSSPILPLSVVGSLNISGATIPTSTVVTLLNSPGNLSIGQYQYAISYVTTLGESDVGNTSLLINITNPTVAGQISLTNIPIYPNNPNVNYKVLARKIYRSKANTRPIYYYVDTINDDTTTTYTDNIPDSSLTIQTPGTGTTGPVLYFNGYPFIHTWPETGYGLVGPIGGGISGSIGIGYSAGNYGSAANVSGANVSIGFQSGESLSTADQSVFIGALAGQKITTGGRDVAIGAEALQSDTVGGGIIAIGQGALTNFTPSGSADVVDIAGQAGLNSLTTGTQNVAIGGYGPFYSITSGSNNVGVGDYAGFNFPTSSSNNTTVGSQSFLTFTTSVDTQGNNTGLGFNVGASIINGDHDTFLGARAGYTDGTTVTTASTSFSTAIGFDSQVRENNAFILGGTSTNAVSVGIGTTSPSAWLVVEASSTRASQDYLQIATSSGAILFNVTGKGAIGFNGNVGTAGQIAQSNGTEATPTWVSPFTSGFQATSTIGQVLATTTADASVVTVTTPNDGNTHSYQVGVSDTINAILTDVMQIQVTYQNQNNSSVTATFYPMGVNSANLSSVGTFQFPSTNIWAYPNTAITVSTILTTSIGTINYDALGSIQRLN